MLTAMAAAAVSGVAAYRASSTIVLRRYTIPRLYRQHHQQPAVSHAFEPIGPTLQCYEPLGTYPPRGKNRCDSCGRKCRKHIWQPSWANPLPSAYALCETCIQNQPDKDDFTQWMGFDIIRTY